MNSDIQQAQQDYYTAANKLQSALKRLRSSRTVDPAVIAEVHRRIITWMEQVANHINDNAGTSEPLINVDTFETRP
jgi:type VI protein secretion system component VasF